jgi:IS1 family transposase
MAVARETRLIVGCCVMKERSWIAMQQFVERLPFAARYCSDALAVYQELMWPDGSSHVVSQKKEETFTIESLNADLRTYLGRLKRRSRCFSRCWEALARAIRLFVWHYNRRRRIILQQPNYRNGLPLYV